VSRGWWRARAAGAAVGGLILVAGAALSGCAGGDSDAPVVARTTPTDRSSASQAQQAGDPSPGAPVPDAVAPGAESVYAHTAAGAFSPAVAGVPARVYVPNSDAGTVDVIDPTTFAITSHFKVGKNPQHITPSYDLKTLYVDNDLGNSLTPIDPMTGRPGPTIPVTDPYNLYFTPDGAKAIVVAEAYLRLDIRDLRTWQVVASVPIAHPGPDHLDFSADGTYLLISCEYSGYVVKVDTATWTVVGELSVGGSPVDVRISPSGRLFYVANQQRDGVSVIDPDAMREVGFIPTGKGTHGLYPSRDGTRLYATNRGEGTVSVIDMARGVVEATWRIGGSPDMGGVSADGTRLWLSGRYSKAVYVVDTSTGALIKTIAVGRGPHGLCLFPQPGRYSLGHTGNYR
jgi:YVTN family beta-propeller protein